MPDSPRKSKCPICGEPSDAHYRPFCSRRCADVDLGRWFSGRYAVSGRENDEEGDSASGSAGMTPDTPESTGGTDEN